MKKERIKLPKRIKVRDPLWVEHLHNGFKEGVHGGDKRARSRRARQQDRLKRREEE